MSRPFFSPSSRQDLADILEYIARDKPGAATRFVEKLKDDCWKLANTPTMAPLREELAPGLRAWPVGNYIIFYRQAPMSSGWCTAHATLAGCLTIDL